MGQKSSSKGFAAVAVLIAILLVAALALSGWFIWQKNHKTTAAKPSNQISQNQKQSERDKAQRPTDLSESGKYLVIKEWDIRLPLSDALRGDIEYGLFDFNDGTQAIYFASKKIATKSTVPDCGGLTDKTDTTGHGKFGGAVALSRFISKPQDDDADVLVYQRGNYWYKLGFSNGGACYDGDTGAETGAFKSAMNTALRNLESIK